MCDFRTKLTAWLDGELSSGDAADVERHIQFCAECRDRVAAYRQVSAAFDGYCDAYCEGALAPHHGQKLPRRKIAISGAATLAAAVAALFFIVPRARIRLLPVPVSVPVASATVVSSPIASAESSEPAPPEVKTVSHLAPNKRKLTPRAASRPQSPEPDWVAVEPEVEIAIPADAIFPPGTVPEDVGFTADVTIAPDGSAQQIRLRPQFTEFERRSTGP
jgi:anti-sigma factor RsiW